MGIVEDLKFWSKEKAEEFWVLHYRLAHWRNVHIPNNRYEWYVPIIPDFGDIFNNPAPSMIDKHKVTLRPMFLMSDGFRYNVAIGYHREAKTVYISKLEEGVK